MHLIFIVTWFDHLHFLPKKPLSASKLILDFFKNVYLENCYPIIATLDANQTFHFVPM